MIELVIKVFDREEKREPFFLVDLPELTKDKATTPIYGTWSSSSPYLGNTARGKYYIRRVPDPDCTDEQRWISGCRGSMGQMGFFFDSRNDPFLLLDSFYPNEPHAKTNEKWGTIRLYALKWPSNADVRYIVK